MPQKIVPFRLIKIQEPRTGSGTSFSMMQSAGIKYWILLSMNRLQRLSLLFFSVTGFSDFCDKIKYA